MLRGIFLSDLFGPKKIMQIIIIKKSIYEKSNAKFAFTLSHTIYLLRVHRM